MEGKIIHLFFSPGVYRALDADTGKELRQVKLADAANPAFTAMTPDGTTLAITYGDGTLRLIDLTNGKTSLTLKLDGDEIYSLAFSRDGKLLALGDAAGQVRLLDAATGNVRVQIPTPLKAVQHLAFAPDGKKLLTTGYVEEPAIVWNVPAGTELCRLAWDAKWLVFCSAFSPDSRCVALGSHQRYLPLYDVATGKEVRRFGPQSSSLCLAFTADGKTLAAGSNAGEIGQWEVATGKRLPASAEPLGGVQALRFTDGGKHLLVAGTAHAVYEWKTGAWCGNIRRRRPKSRTARLCHPTAVSSRFRSAAGGSSSGTRTRARSSAASRMRGRSGSPLCSRPTARDLWRRIGAGRSGFGTLPQATCFTS